MASLKDAAVIKAAGIGPGCNRAGIGAGDRRVAAAGDVIVRAVEFQGVGVVKGRGEGGRGGKNRAVVQYAIVSIPR